MDAAPHASRLDVGVVSAGRVGAVLGAALGRAGHRVVATSAVSQASLDRARCLLPEARVLAADEVARRAALLLLAVPDDALSTLVNGLAETGALHAGQLIVHTSGRFGTDVLEPASRLGALPLALHPVLPFAGTGLDLSRLPGACFGVTAPEPLRPIGEALVVEMAGEPVWVTEQLRPLWHAALAHGANHLVTLVSSAADLLREAGVQDPGAVLGPLLGVALDGALRAGDGALTGPVVRGDAGTVAAHLAVLPEQVRGAYAALARLTADRALASGRLSTDQAAGLLGALS